MSGLPPLDVALLLGSTRATGWTRLVAQALVDAQPPTLRLRPVEIGDLPLYLEEREQAPPAEWERFRAEIRRADGLLFVTPEYNRSIPAMLKNAVDIGSSPDDQSVWARKPAAIATHSPGRLGGFGANHHLRQAMVFLDVPVLPQPEVYLAEVNRLFDDQGRLTSGPAEQLLRQLLDALGDWVRRLRR